MNSFLNFFNAQLALGNFSIMLLVMAFVGGLLMSLSPCNLAMLPLILGYVAGKKDKGIKQTLLQLLLFFIGFSLVFAVIGTIAVVAGNVFKAVLNTYWILFIASVILIFGLNMVGLIEFNYPMLMKQVPTRFQNHQYFFALIIGMFFALAATPCSTPILLGIAGSTTLQANVLLGAIMFFLFSLGQSLIIIFAGLFTSFLKNLQQMSFLTKYSTFFAGIMFILFSLIIYFKVFEQFILH